MLMENQSQQMLGDEVAATRFALIDLTLYLDTHPNDKDALRLFSEYRDQLAKLQSRYVNMYGPLTVGDVSGKNGWTWTETPMPFEGGNEVCGNI